MVGLRWRASSYKELMDNILESIYPARCEYCGEEFWYLDGHLPTGAKYCSNKCLQRAFRERYRGKNMMQAKIYRRLHPKPAKERKKRLCLVCLNEFSAYRDWQKYCSRKCRNTWGQLRKFNRYERMTYYYVRWRKAVDALANEVKSVEQDNRILA